MKTKTSSTLQQGIFAACSLWMLTPNVALSQTINIGPNQYAFQFTQNPNYGLFFNSTSTRYDFRNGNGDAVFGINANTGRLTTNIQLESGRDYLVAPGNYAFRSAAAPNAGLFFGATNYEILRTNGVVALSVNAINGSVGIGTYEPSHPLHVYGVATGQGNVVFEGQVKNQNFGSAPVEGSGTRMMWYPDKAAFRAGNANSTSWLTHNIGHNSAAFGSFCRASGSSSFAAGYENNATGSSATAMGNGCWASGQYGTAIGKSCTSSGISTVALGNGTTAQAFAEVVLGSWNQTTTVFNATEWVPTDRLLVVGNGTFSTSRSNAMVILKNGRAGFGTSNPSTNLEVGGSGVRTMRISSTGSSDVRLEFLRTGSSFTDWRIANVSGNLTFSRSSNDLILTTDIVQMNAFALQPAADATLQLGRAAERWTTVWATNGTINTSDARDKTNIREISYGLDDIRKLRPVSFEWKDDVDNGTKLGLIAQELQQVLPEVVRDWDYMDDEENGLRKVDAARLGVYYSDIIPVLIRGIQELDQQVQTSSGEALLQEFMELKEENAAIRNENNAMLEENAEIRNQLNAFDSDLIPVLIKGLQEVDHKVEALEPHQIEDLRERLDEKDNEIAELKALVNKLIDRQNRYDGDLESCCFHQQGQKSSTPESPDAAELGLNVPNPFRESTLIHYYLPENVQQALMRVSTLEGKPVKDINLGAAQGHNQVEFHTNGMAAGTYLYSLFVNSELVATRKMMVSR